MSTAQEVATTILHQLGGNKFRAMTGARNFLATSEGRGGLSLRLPVRFARNGINHVQVTLDASDTYSLTFNKIGPRPKYTLTTVRTLDGIYAEDLQRIFTDITGLDTHL